MSDTPKTDRASFTAGRTRVVVVHREFARNLERRNARLLQVLEALVDCQNGCPLPKYEQSWTAAMASARAEIRKDLESA